MSSSRLLHFTEPLFYQPFQFFAGEEYAAFNRAYRQVHMLGDLFVFKALVEHQKGYPVNGVEFVDGILVFFQLDIHLALVDHRVLVLKHKQEIFDGLVDVPAPFVLAVLIDEGITHDGSTPALEIGAYFELVAVFVGTQRSFLYQIFGVLLVFGQPDSKGE